MKVLFSEFAPDYSRYLYPYVVLAIPEAGETPADLYEAGFHPASPGLDRFTLCRHLRLPLPGFLPSSENRRILRRVSHLTLQLVPRRDFEDTSERRAGWLAFAEQRFGPGVMPASRLAGLMEGRGISHLLIARDPTRGDREVGQVLLYLEPPRMAHYYYAFYERENPNPSLGLGLMTRAIGFFQQAGYRHLYLGTCYSRRALYKTRFRGIEFFNGRQWSTDLRQLRFLLDRPASNSHLLADPGFPEVGDEVNQAYAHPAFRLSRAASGPAGS